jgi:hypothetical protein
MKSNRTETEIEELVRLLAQNFAAELINKSGEGNYLTYEQLTEEVSALLRKLLWLWNNPHETPYKTKAN